MSIHRFGRGQHFAIVMVLVGAVGGSSAWAGTKEPAESPSGAETADPDLRDYYSANGLLNRGLYDLAVTEYRKFLETHEEHEKAPVARYGLAVSLYRLERFEEAVTELSKLRGDTEMPYAPEVLTILGQCLMSLDRAGDAGAAFDTVVREHAGHALADDAAAGAAEAFYRAGKYEEAEKRCRLLVTQWPKSPLRERAEFFWGLSAMARDDFKSAAWRFAGVLRDHRDGPFADQASLLLAQCHQNGGELEQAARVYHEILKRPDARFMPDALLGLGQLELNQGRTEQAAALFERLLKEQAESPQAAAARFYLARAWFEQEKFDQALAGFRKSAAEQKGTPLEDDTAYWVAKCRLRQGEPAEAARLLAAAAEGHPGSDLLPEMIYDRAVALARAGEVKEVGETLDAFGKRFDDHPLVADALYLRATTAHDLQAYDESLARCRDFKERFAGHSLAPAVEFLAAENEFLSGRHAEAADRYRQFLQRHPADERAGRARYRQGVALYHLERFDDAAPLLAESVKDAEGEAFHSGRLALGDIYFQRGEWKTAADHLQTYLTAGKDVSGADDALLKLGLARERQSDHERALEAFDLLIHQYKESPHRLQAMFERGQVLTALDRYDEAVKAFHRVLDDGGDSRFKPYALNHLGSLAMRRQDFDGAARLFERASSAGEALDPAEVLLNRGQALLAAGQFDQAGKVLAELREKYPAHDRAAMGGAHLAIALSREDRYEDALEMIEQMERGQLAKLDAQLRASVKYEKAWCLRKLGRSEDAAKTYRTLLSGDPPRDLAVHATLELAGIEAENERFQEAAELLWGLRRSTGTNDAVKLPADVREQLTYQLGVSEYQLGRLSEAAELFEEFLSLFPESSLMASASFFCGDTLHKLEKHDRAAAHLARVVEKFPNDPALGPSLLRLGECLTVLQRWPRSEQVFSEYLSQFGDSEQWFQARFGLGWARENQGRHDEAIREYRTVVDRHNGPTVARAQFQIGECLFAQKKYDDAARELLKVDILYDYPEWSAAALYEAGQVFDKLNKRAEARRQFQAVTERFGDSRWAAMANKRLSDLAASSVPGR